MAKRIDADSAAALEIMKTETMHEEIAIGEQERKEKLLAQTYRMMGRIETADMFGKLGHGASLMWLKQVKDSRVYKELPGVDSWESFCNHLGKSRRAIDEQLQNLDALGEDFLAHGASLGLGRNDFRKLRKAVNSGEIIIEATTVKIGDEVIPYSPEYRDDFQAALESVLEAKENVIEEKDATIKAKERVIKEKERVIQKQERELGRYEKQIKERDFKPGEENFIKEMENIKTIFMGLTLKLDPENLPEDATVLMKTSFIETIGQMKRTIHAYYDTATVLYGNDDDDEWEPSACG